jgi:hypothetical protein
MTYMAGLYNLSGGERVYPPEVACGAFGADWAAACFIPLANNDFSPGYDAAAIFCFQNNDIADVYLIGVFNADGFREGSNAYRLYEAPRGFRFV